MRTHEFVVSGRGSFPTDMLRYDSCWPATERDSATVAATFERIKGVREVREVSMRGLAAPTDGRWESFGWKVS
jgi:hypothetical protein